MESRIAHRLTLSTPRSLCLSPRLSLGFSSISSIASITSIRQSQRLLRPSLGSHSLLSLSRSYVRPSSKQQQKQQQQQQKQQQQQQQQQQQDKHQTQSETQTQVKITNKHDRQADSTTMTTTVQLASVPSADTPGTCVFLHHDKRSYVFGRVSEGTQRAFGSRKISMGATEHVFLSGDTRWDQLGGLYGFLLTVGGTIEAAKEGVAAENERRSKSGGGGNPKRLVPARHPGVGVHGGDNLCHALAACRPVIFRQPIAVRTFEHREDPRAEDPACLEPDWADECIKVWKVPVRRARSSSARKRSADGQDRDGGDGVDRTPRNGEELKPRVAVSDPDVASSIVERIMFSGSLKTRSVLVPVKLKDLKPADVAVVHRDGVLRQYQGPYTKSSTATETSAGDDRPIPDADSTAWLFPEAGDKGHQGPPNDPKGRTLAINHHPLPATTYGATSMSYIVKCHSRRGKFNAPLATSLGIEPKQFKLLAAGQTVQGRDGPVTPDMVLGDPQPGRGIAVADIGGADFLDAFLARPEWRCAELMADVAVMYWILAPGLAGDARLQAFMRGLAPGIKHILCSEDTCPNMITHAGAARIQTQLRRIDPDRFPLLSFDNTASLPSTASPSSSSSTDIELGRAGHKLQLMPRLVYDNDATAPFPDLLSAHASVDPEVLALAAAASSSSSSPSLSARIARSEHNIPNRDAEIIPLGTGSSVPSKYRNVSSTLIRVPGIGNYLLDCGEGTLGQLHRLFGPEGTAAVLRDLRCIVISHVHADHHLGTPSVIRAWYAQSLADETHSALLAISCLDRYRQLLQELSQLEDLGFHRLRFPSCSPPTSSSPSSSPSSSSSSSSSSSRMRSPSRQNYDSSPADRDLTTPDMLGTPADNHNTFGLRSIRRIPVPHCWRSYATQLELSSGLRIAYSGDCRPSRAFAAACRGAHLLVHECTFADDKPDHARAKRHCTMAEALAVAKDMGARRTLLTHFSQRYSKQDSLSRAADEGGEAAVLLAFDHMRVRLGDFQKAALFLPAVQKLMEKMGD